MTAAHQFKNKSYNLTVFDPMSRERYEIRSCFTPKHFSHNKWDKTQWQKFQIDEHMYEYVGTKPLALNSAGCIVGSPIRQK